MQRIKITVVTEEPYEYQYSKDHPVESRIREIKSYEQIVFRTGEPDNNIDGLVKDIAAIVNGIKS